MLLCEDSRRGAFGDEGAERVVAAAAAQPQFRRVRDDVVEAALGGAEPAAPAFARLVLHLFANQRSVLDLEWFEDQAGSPVSAALLGGRRGYPQAPPGRAREEARRRVAVEVLREAGASTMTVWPAAAVTHS